MSGRKIPSTISRMTSSDSGSNVISISWRARSVGSAAIRGVRRSGSTLPPLDSAIEDGADDAPVRDLLPHVGEVGLCVRQVAGHVEQQPEDVWPGAIGQLSQK